ncbi:MAG: gliding motility-associated C-terminal domain-containing protein [Saprospiraceae bacterium]|nr:gliding motility-associated C-terminal domain-containing protein [Saprospiraceae bacterium]
MGKTLGGAGRDVAYNGIRLNDGSYIIVGHSDSNASGEKSENSRGDLDIWAIRIDKSGNKIWDKTYGGNRRDEFPTGLTITKDGNFVFACGSLSDFTGEKTSTQRGIKDFWVVKCASNNGQKIWDSSFGGDLADEPYDVQELSDESLIVAGNSRSAPNTGNKKSQNFGDADYWIVKMNSSGKYIWDKSYGGSKNDYIISIDQNKTGYFLVAGQSNSPVSGTKTDSLRGNVLDAGGNPTFDFWILYLDEAGNEIWQKAAGGSFNDAAFELVKFKSGAYLVAGLSNSRANFDKSEDNRDPQRVGTDSLTNDMWVLKINCLYDLNLGNDTLICRLEPVPLNAEIAGCRNCLYRWSTGERSANIIAKPIKSTRYTVNVTVNTSCEVRDNIDIIIIPPPDTVAFVTKPPRCHDGKDGVLAIDSIKGGTAPFSLVVGKDTFRQRVFINDLSAGTYSVTLLDKNNCRLEDSVTIPNPPKFEVEMSEPIEIPLGDSTLVWAKPSQPIDTFFWNDKTIRSLETIVRPFESFTFVFTAIDTNGCAVSNRTQVIVRRENNYYTPSVFSPNGDGINDFFTIFGGKTVRSISNLQIFDRWGSRWFVAQSMTSPEGMPIIQGWDGTADGKEALPGVYVYFAEVTYIDGRTEQIRGDFTLLR